jgi:hypothetical protein
VDEDGKKQKEGMREGLMDGGRRDGGRRDGGMEGWRMEGWRDGGREGGRMEGWRDGGRRDGGRRDVWGSWRAGRLESKKKEINRDVAIVHSNGRVHINISQEGGVTLAPFNNTTGCRPQPRNHLNI